MTTLGVTGWVDQVKKDNNSWWKEATRVEIGLSFSTSVMSKIGIMFCLASPLDQIVTCH